MTPDFHYGPGRTCVVSCVTDPQMSVYMAGLARLKRKLVQVGYEGSWRLWGGCYPPNSPRHEDAPYGFKVAAIDEARRAGYSQILWLDAEAFPVKPLDPFFELLANRGVVSVSGHDPLGEWCSDAALWIITMGLRPRGRPWAHGEQDADWGTPKVQAGKVYAFDCSTDLGVRFMAEWRDLLGRGAFAGPAINTGAGPEVESRARAALGHRSAGFCSADPRVLGHRHDEIAAGYLVWRMMIESGTVNDWVYGGTWTPEAAAKPDVYFCGLSGDQEPVR